MKLYVWYHVDVMRSFACRLLYKWYRMLECGSTRMTPAINGPSPRSFIINFIQYMLYLRLQVYFNRYRIGSDLLAIYLFDTLISERVPLLNKVQQRSLALFNGASLATRTICDES